jgi:lysozyme
MKISNNGLNLITQFEGLKLKVYLDSASIPTIGYGSTYYEDGSRVVVGDSDITQERALQLLEVAVNKKTIVLNNLIKVNVNQNEFDAICCWCYNVGEGNVASSTLLKLLNSNADKNSIGDQFLKWNKAGGQEIPGLTRRRQAERALFLHPVVESNQDELSSGPSEDDINNKLNQIEDDIMKK